MTPNTWQELKTIFQSALDLEPDQRARFIAKACDGNVELRTRLEKMLASNEVEDFLASPAVIESGLVSAARLEKTWVGQRLGSYEVVREIGHGGMGTVFLAVRANDKYRKPVAIKLIKRGMDTDLILRRFMMEQDILANLKHPNIAELLEGSSTPDGLPYFVMEYIEGQPITTYCDTHEFSNDERLELFRQVCDALQYAHQNLVVHRDIKPSNILVTAEGVPKLLDFGIAKLLGPGLAGETVEATASFVRLMTPEYASPEQLRGLTITTASDVYSLGIVLYELLSGRHPYRLVSRQPQEVAEVVLREEPEKPSSAASRSQLEDANATGSQPPTTDNGPGTAKTNPKSEIRNPKFLRGDLDNIVLKALRKEPQRRYASVQEFSEDIRRHLEGLPVTASPDTFGYRAGKFVQRHKVGVLAAAIVIVTLLSATGITAWQARVARRERNKAESRFNQVRKLANTVLFDYHERIKTLPGATETRKKLVTDALEYLDNLSQDSDNSPELQRELALAYQKVGDIQGSSSESAHTGETGAALGNYRKALAIQERLISQTQGTADDRRTLAKLYIQVGDQLAALGDVQSQLESSRRAVKVLSEFVQNDPTNTATRSDLAFALYSLGTALRSSKDLDGAIAAFRQSAQIYEQLASERTEKSDTYRRLAARSYKTLGGTLEIKGDHSSALELYRRALAIDAENSAAHPNNVQYQLDLTFSHNSIASVLSNTGNFKEALENCQKALAIQEKVAADDAKNYFAQNALARTYRRMGDILNNLNRFDEASANYQKSIRMFEELGKGDSNSVNLKGRLGEIYAIFGNFLLSRADKPDAQSSKAQRLRRAQTFQKRGLDIFMALKAQNALDPILEERLADVQNGLQQTEKELAKNSIR